MSDKKSGILGIGILDIIILLSLYEGSALGPADALAVAFVTLMWVNIWIITILLVVALVIFLATRK